jgi:hypothetical protein
MAAQTSSILATWLRPPTTPAWRSRSQAHRICCAITPSLLLRVIDASIAARCSTVINRRSTSQRRANGRRAELVSLFALSPIARGTRFGNAVPPEIADQNPQRKTHQCVKHDLALPEEVFEPAPGAFSSMSNRHDAIENLRVATHRAQTDAFHPCF